jgi:hypothetical protein
MKKLTVETHEVSVNPGGNWNIAKDHFPVIRINQETGVINVESYRTEGRQKKASVETTMYETKVSDDKSQVLISGEVYCRNWINAKTSGTQAFVFAIFEGDSGHIYIHRAPATKGWINCNPNTIRKRLVKLGIGATSGVLQQGDFLLKPANGSSLPVDSFKHEWTSASHHKFSEPVLSEYVSGVGRIIFIPEGRTVELHHEAVDGIQHPMIVVPAGQWIIGSTASQLHHTNKRD